MDPLVPQLQWPLGSSQPTQGKHFHRQLFRQETLLAAIPSDLSSNAFIFIVGIFTVWGLAHRALSLWSRVSPEQLYLLPLQSHPVTHFPRLTVLPLCEQEPWDRRKAVVLRLPPQNK